jgi:hypothetical protein
MGDLGPEVSSGYIEAVLGMIDDVARVIDAQPGGSNHYANFLEDRN